MAILLWGIPSGDDFTWDLTYKFKTEECVIETTGYTTGFAKYANPTRELKFSLGVTGEDTLDRLSAFLNAGVTTVTTPLWFFRTSLTAGITTGTNEIPVNDPSEYYAGEQALIMLAHQPSICELVTIASVAGSTVYTTSPIANDYHPLTMPSESSPYDTLSAYVMPVITGYLEYEGLDYISGLPALGMKAKIDSGVWESFTVPSMPSDFVFQAMDAKYNNPKILRDLCGVENGIISMYAHGDSSKLTFECTWNFCDSNWKTLRDIFFAARGKAQSFFIPTNMYELATTRGADAGSTTIYLNPGYQYLYERFPYIMVYSRRTTNRFLVHITDHVWRDEFTCDALDHELYDGSRACIYPQVFFESDELTFSFKGINMCYVKATFIEDPS